MSSAGSEPDLGPEQLGQELRELIDRRRSFGGHPLWWRISRGELDLPELRCFAAQFFLQSVEALQSRHEHREDAEPHRRGRNIRILARIPKAFHQIWKTEALLKIHSKPTKQLTSPDSEAVLSRSRRSLPKSL